MATKYTIVFTDATKASFDIQPFTTNGPVSPIDPAPIDVAANTTLSLYGQSFQDYGEGVWQDMVYLLENFASPIIPVRATEGQLWYNNGDLTGSPTIPPQLFIRGSNVNPLDDIADWDAVILATGTSPMTGELILSGNPISDLGAVPKQFMDSHTLDFDVHITTDQNTFLDALDLPALTGAEANFLIGVTSNIQVQLDDKISRVGDSMDSLANLTFFGGGEVLGLPVTPSQASAATSAAYVDAHIADADPHLTTDQNTFLDALDLPTLTGAEVNFLIGVTSNVQAQLDSKLTNAGGNMLSGANISFTGGGEVLGLPAIPSVDGAAASRKYVDDQITAAGTGDGVVTGIVMTNTGIGSPTPDINETTLELTVTFPNFTTSVFEVEGISRVGHTQPAADVILDNTFNVAYPTNMQAGVEHIEIVKANLLDPIFTNNIAVVNNITASGGTFNDVVSGILPTLPPHFATKEYVDFLTAGSIPDAGGVQTRIFDALTSDLISPTPYLIQNHASGNNSISITINGIKQYLGTRSSQDIVYDSIANEIQVDAPTGLDPLINYDFNISVDGGPATLITIFVGTDVSTHALLVGVINDAMGGSPILVDADFTISTTNTETFRSFSQGGTSSISITDPATANTYLFNIDPSPKTIVDATFISDPGFPVGFSPAPTPDTIEIAGDHTSVFVVGQQFTIRGSDDVTYGTYDGVYSVHANGATFDSINTIIPIGVVNDSDINNALLPNYDPINGSPPDPAPTPSPFGTIYVQPLLAFIEVATATAGIEGDYIETDVSGATVPINTLTEYVVFNYDILTGSKIESLSFA